MNGESSMEIYTLPYVKQIASGNLLYDSGNSTLCSVLASRVHYWDTPSILSSIVKIYRGARLLNQLPVTGEALLKTHSTSQCLTVEKRDSLAIFGHLSGSPQRKLSYYFDKPWICFLGKAKNKQLATCDHSEDPGRIVVEVGTAVESEESQVSSGCSGLWLPHTWPLCRKLSTISYSQK